MNISKGVFKPACMLFAMSAVLFSGSLWPSAQAGGNPKSKAAAPITIPITITFGRASKKCAGWGICKITLGIVSAGERTVEAELTRVGDGKLQITVLKKVPEEGRTLFIDEDIPLSQEIAEKLGPITNPNMSSDLTTSIVLAEAAITGALANVEINLQSLKDEAFVQEMRKRTEAVKG